MTKRIISLFLASLMLFTGMTVAFAESPAAPTAPTINQMDSQAVIVAGDAGCEFACYEVPAEGEDAPAASELEWSYSTLITGLEPETDYILAARIAATGTTEASEIATTEFTTPADADFTGYTVEVELDHTTKTITCPKETFTYLDTEFNAIYSIAPADDVASTKDEDGNTLFYNLTPGVTYTVKIGFKAIATTYICSDDCADSVTLKFAQDAPSAPVPTKTTSSTITVEAVTGVEYACVATGSSEEFVWGSKTTFENLAPETSYTVYARLPENDDYYASAKASITLTTLKAGDTEIPAAPVLKDKNNTSITVDAISGYEYSIDNGNTWNSTGVFTGLESNKLYSIITRKAFDASVQDPNPASEESLDVFTNKRANYEAAFANSTLTVNSENIYAQQEYTFTLENDAPDVGDLQYGDTKYVAVGYTVEGGEYVALNGATEGKFTAAAKDADYKITVNYELQKYNGEDWTAIDTAEKTFSVNVLDVYNATRNIFVKIINFFTNALPLIIIEIAKSVFSMIG